MLLFGIAVNYYYYYLACLLACIETTSNVKSGVRYFETGHAKSALGFLHSRTNLSPFTKDFRGGDQLDEYLTIFLRSGLVQTDFSQVNFLLKT